MPWGGFLQNVALCTSSCWSQRNVSLNQQEGKGKAAGTVLLFNTWIKGLCSMRSVVFVHQTIARKREVQSIQVNS